MKKEIREVKELKMKRGDFGDRKKGNIRIYN